MAAAGNFESHGIAIELFGGAYVADTQMDVSDPQPGRRAGKRGGRRHLAQDILDVERIRDHPELVAAPLPALGRPVAIDLDAVAFGIIEVDGFTDPMIGGAGKGHLVSCDMQNPAREIAARRHQKGRVIEAGGALIIRLRICSMLEMQQGYPSGAERGAVAVAIEDG